MKWLNFPYNCFQLFLSIGQKLSMGRKFKCIFLVFSSLKLSLPAIILINQPGSVLLILFLSTIVIK